MINIILLSINLKLVEHEATAILSIKDNGQTYANKLNTRYKMFDFVCKYHFIFYDWVLQYNV